MPTGRLPMHLGIIRRHKGIANGMSKTRIKGGKKLDAFLRKAKYAKGVNNVEVGFYDTATYPPVRTGLRGGQKQNAAPGYAGRALERVWHKEHPGAAIL